MTEHTCTQSVEVGVVIFLDDHGWSLADKKEEAAREDDDCVYCKYSVSINYCPYCGDDLRIDQF